MGNTSSKNDVSSDTTDVSSLASHIDDIAIHYILNQNTIDLLRLTDKEYYDNLIILTSSVIEKKFNMLELGFLNNRIFGKKTISDIIDVMPSNNKLKEKVIFNISKFYIKIIMVYSAIATTIDPQYSYETEEGSKKTFYLKDINEYKNIPKNVKPILVQLTNPMNLCRKRLDILKNKLDLNVDGAFVKLNPGEKLCSLSTTSKLTDEVGIKELDSLYYDIFDYQTKTWSKRSKKMKQKYNKDLILFYQIFTGKKDKPLNIQTFHDIELLDMSRLDHCSDLKFMQDILIEKNNTLIQQYIQKINLIENTAQKYRVKLIDILKELFVIKLNDNESKYTINPELTLDHIMLLEIETRDTILNLYTSCEKYFIQALILFETIYNEKVKVLNEERINYIDKIKSPPPEVIEPISESYKFNTEGPSGEVIPVFEPSPPFESALSPLTPAFANAASPKPSPVPAFGTLPTPEPSPVPAFGTSPTPEPNPVPAFGTSPTPEPSPVPAFGTLPTPEPTPVPALNITPQPAFGTLPTPEPSPVPALNITPQPAFGTLTPTTPLLNTKPTLNTAPALNTTPSLSATPSSFPATQSSFTPEQTPSPKFTITPEVKSNFTFTNTQTEKTQDQLQSNSDISKNIPEPTKNSIFDFFNTLINSDASKNDISQNIVVPLVIAPPTNTPLTSVEPTNTTLTSVEPTNAPLTSVEPTNAPLTSVEPSNTLTTNKPLTNVESSNTMPSVNPTNKPLNVEPSNTPQSNTPLTSVEQINTTQKPII